MAAQGFGRLHPALTFGFFLFAIALSVVVQHPAYVVVSLVGAICLDLTLLGRRAFKTIAAYLPLWLVLTALNPLFNPRGEHVLLQLGARPYTLEALLYGACLSGMLVAVLLWFSAYHVVMTEDKFGYLFAGLAPSLALLLTLIFRLVPEFGRKAGQILSARACIGLGGGAGAPLKRRLSAAMLALSALTAWALEGSVVTADAMNSRGYGTGKRTRFHTYHLRCTDRLLMVAWLLLLALTLWGILSGGAAATFVPMLQLARPNFWGLGGYALLLLTPAILNLREELIWHFSKSNI
jgi:energy-coupling factor transport system permease protein